MPYVINLLSLIIYFRQNSSFLQDRGLNKKLVEERIFSNRLYILLNLATVLKQVLAEEWGRGDGTKLIK